MLQTSTPQVAPQATDNYADRVQSYPTLIKHPWMFRASLNQKNNNDKREETKSISWWNIQKGSWDEFVEQAIAL